MIEAWRIDSLDPRGGLAFAAWRDADLGSATLALDDPAVFLSPPLFQPEPVNSRALGFSAARGQSQLGVFVDGQELAFETLADLTEFVRRVYQAGGGGDAGGGGAVGGGPPPPPDGGPEVPRGERRAEERDVEDDVLFSAARLARSISSDLTFIAGGTAVSAPLDTSALLGRTKGVSGSSLVAGATEILLELLRRFPLHRSQAALGRWTRSAHSLGAAITRLGLWPDIMTGTYADDFDTALDRIVSPAPPWPLPIRGYLLPFLFGANSVGGPLTRYHLELIEYLSWHHSALHWGAVALNDGDPVDHLTFWPLPAEIASLVATVEQDPSVFNLFSALSAAPGQMAAAGDKARRATAILLFSAAHLLAEARSFSHGSWLVPEARDAQRVELAQEAGAWMLQQWPTMLFAEKIEAVIGQAATLRDEA